MPSKVWDEITYSFLNFNSCTIEVWEWTNNLIPHFMMDKISSPCWDKVHRAHLLKIKGHVIIQYRVIKNLILGPCKYEWYFNVIENIVGKILRTL